MRGRLVTWERTVACGVVVTQKVPVEGHGGLPVDQVREGQPVVVAVPRAAARGHLLDAYVEGGEGCGRAVA